MKRKTVSPRLLPAALALVLCLTMTGCGLSRDRRELERLRPVQTLGYDLRDGEIVLSAAAGAPEGRTLRLEGEAAGLQEAMEALKENVPEGELFFPHARYVLAGRRTAEEAGLESLLDYMKRDEALSLDINLFLLDNGEAAAALADCEDATKAIEAALDRCRGCKVSSAVRELMWRLSENGAAPVRLLERREAQTEEDAGGFLCSGWGILRDGRLAGTVSGPAAEAAEAILGSPARVVRTIEGVSLACTLSPCRLRREGNRVEVACPVRVVSVAQDGTVPEQVLADAVAGDLLQALEQARELGADWLDLGRRLRRPLGTDPGEWLRNLEFTVTALVTWESEDDIG